MLDQAATVQVMRSKGVSEEEPTRLADEYDVGCGRERSQGRLRALGSWKVAIYRKGEDSEEWSVFPLGGFFWES